MIEKIKRCRICQETKLIELFTKKGALCKSCDAAKSRAYKKENRGKDPEKDKAQSKKYYEKHKERKKERRKERLSEDPEAAKEYQRTQVAKWRKSNKEKYLAYVNNYTKERLSNNPDYKIRVYTRNRIRKALKTGIRVASSIELIGCSVEQLRLHLESQFLPGMNWENHGLDGWHIDHIRPCASFDLAKDENQRACFHFSNMQPLWASDNLKKQATYHK